MPKLLTPEVETLALGVSGTWMTPFQVFKAVSGQGHNVSVRSVYNIINCHGERRSAICTVRDLPVKPHAKWVRSKELIKKIDLWTSKLNPPTSTEMCKRSKVSKGTIQKIIHKDLKKTLQKKLQLPAVRNFFIANCKTNCRNTQHIRKKLGITIISKREIPIKSPHASPMDFFWIRLPKIATVSEAGNQFWWWFGKFYMMSGHLYPKILLLPQWNLGKWCVKHYAQETGITLSKPNEFILAKFLCKLIY